MISFTRIILVCLLLISIVQGHDLLSPQWRGEPNTTFQHFMFNGPNNPAGPELENNIYGTAQADINSVPPGIGWLDGPLPTFGTQTGLWDLGPQGSITIQVPVNEDSQQISLQITYLEAFWPEPNIIVDNAILTDEQTVLVEDAGMGAYWYLKQTLWTTLVTNNIEIVVITDTDGGDIDQIVIDTRPISSESIVDYDELRDLAEQWLLNDTNLNMDLNGDYTVNFLDFAILAQNWREPL